MLEADSSLHVFHMKLSICFTALAVCSSLAQEPPPNSAPDYHIPLPAEALVPRPVVQTQKIDGVITFWENAVPLCATLAQRFGWIGHTPQAALNARNKYLTRQTLENAKLAKYQPAWALIKQAAAGDARGIHPAAFAGRVSIASGGRRSLRVADRRITAPTRCAGARR